MSDLRIGIWAFGSDIGVSGGVDVFTRTLIDALANFAPDQHFVILVNENAEKGWAYRQWPPHIQFEVLHQAEPLLPQSKRVLRRLKSLGGWQRPPHYGEAYLSRQIDELHLDLIHFPQTIIGPKSFATPCTLTLFDMQHEFYPQFFTPNELAWRNRDYPASILKARGIIVPTEYTAKTLIDRYEIYPRKLEVIPVGLDDKFRRLSNGKITAIREKYALPEEFIYYPANPWQHKNHARLMAALRIYGERYGEIPWLVLSGRLLEERRDATSLAIAAGVQDRVIDLGYVPLDELQALYSAATMMVFPSLFEGFGMPLVEAMACGCPVAASNATTIPEITNGAALLFDPLDPSAIADATYQLLRDHNIRKSLLERGYSQLDRFSWESIVAEMTNCFSAVLEGD